MRKSLRYLRIAFSATCLIACVLLIALWVRSYWRWEIFHFPITTQRMVLVGSKEGRLSATSYLPDALLKMTPYRTGVIYTGWGHWKSKLRLSQSDNRRMFTTGSDTYFTYIGFPYWIAVLLFSTIGFLPRLRWRFSLSTLLIATTLIAVVLGLIVWLRI